MADRKITRRKFVEKSTLAVAGMAAAAGATNAAGATEADPKKILNYNPNMEYRRCGKTGLMVSAVCMGGHWKRIDKVVPNAFKGRGWLSAGLDDPNFQKNRYGVVSRLIDRGINYIDACTSQEVLTYSRALKGRRDRMYLGFSWYQKEMRNKNYRTTKALVKTLEDGMREAGLDYVDLWRITLHEQSDKHTKGEIEEMIGALAQAKKDGKARFTGFSSHHRGHIQWMIETFTDQIDVIVTPYTARTKALPKDSLFDTLKKYDVGFFGIKPFASNSLFKGDSSPGNPQEEEDHRRARLALRYILCNPSITAPIPGLITPEQVDNACKAVLERRQLDLKETAELEKATEEMWASLPPDYQWLKDWEYV